MIAITGANGRLGSATIGFLRDKIDPSSIVALVRDPRKIQDLNDTGIQIRVADYDDPASLRAAFRHVEKVLQISAISTGARGLQQEANVVQAAHQQGVKQMVYTSALNAHDATHFFSAQQCLQTEKAILKTGIPYTFFRNSLYLETIPQFIGPALQTGEIAFPAGDGTISFVSRWDIAEALSVVLTEEHHACTVYTITGTTAYTFRELAAQLQETTGKSVAYTDIPMTAFREELAALQLPAGEIDWFVSLAESIRANEFAQVDNALEKILVRKPLSLPAYLKSS